ncbi:MAG TPA: anti-sigma factor [Xanthobacteraceae bacterium]|nr:anti-sigma factor [Xanthobacteraceae bacterium]
MTTPTTPEDPTLLIHAYVDGELDPANALDVERRLAADPALAAERDRVMALRAALNRHFPREPAPASLRARVDTIGGLRRAEQPSWRALAASVALAAIVGSGATYLALAPREAAPTQVAVLDAHIRAMMAPQAFDVASSDKHTVKPWFNGRLAEAPRVIDLANDDFPLAGGRVDVVDRAPAATLVYRHRKHLISLVEVPTHGRADSGPVRRMADGYNIVHWTEGGVTYWAVSDIGAGDLEDFVQKFRTTPAE